MIEFLLACAFMGLGIGADVGIATVLQAAQLKNTQKACIWLVGVTLTHTLFPMFGYLLTYFSVQNLPFLTPMVGLFAFSLIAYFLWQEYQDNRQQQEASHNLVKGQSVSLSIGLILAVSWDALWSGPAKSAQVIGWSEWQIWCSFILVGAVVALCGLMGLYMGRTCSALGLGSARFLKVGQWLQYSVIGYFALLALLRYTLSIYMDAWQVFIMSALLVACVLFPISQLAQRLLIPLLPEPILSKLKTR